MHSQYGWVTDNLLSAPFVASIFLTLGLSTYMLSESSDVVMRVMQLTPIPGKFKFFLLLLAVSSFALSWAAEYYVFPSLARMIGRGISLVWPKKEKNRRQYKVLLEKMRL